jgi:hypothetical protein
MAREWQLKLYGNVNVKTSTAAPASNGRFSMTRGRPALPEIKKRVTFNIEESVLAKYEMLILDPVSNRSRWGVKSMIVEKLFLSFFNAYATGDTTIDIRDLLHILRN